MGIAIGVEMLFDHKVKVQLTADMVVPLVYAVIGSSAVAYGKVVVLFLNF